MTKPRVVERRFRVNGASASRSGARERWRRVSLDFLLLAFFAFVMAELGPYRTLEAPQPLRTIYWLIAVLGSGMAGILADRLLSARVRNFWLRILIASLAATPPVTLYIYALNAVMLDLPRRWWLLPQLAWQVLVVMLLVMTFRALL